MSSLKPITLYGHERGPNPWKVVMLLEELGLKYEHKFVEMSQMHEKPFTNITLNGRVPAIEDPNTGLKLWESGAILEYIQETYDKSNQYGGTGLDRFLVKQWLHFQMSGQGPYFGQAVWFKVYHPEKMDSAVTRYRNEALRVIGVLNTHLEGKTYLVGEKCTIADLAFVPWNEGLSFVLGEDYEKADIEKKFPAYWAWHKRVTERPAVKKTLDDKTAATSAMKPIPGRQG